MSLYQLNQISDFVKQSMSKINDSSHNMDHIDRVVEYAMDICNNKTTKTHHLEKKNFDVKKVVWCAAMLHDVCDYKYDGINNRDTMIKIIHDNTTELEGQVIIDIIDNISHSKEVKYGVKNLKQYNILRNIVSDADKIDAMGQVGLNRCYAYGRHKNPDLDEDAITVLVVKHCEEKLIKLLSDFIKTDYGKNLAQDGHQVIKEFLYNARK
jgi:uncharacterized protein